MIDPHDYELTDEEHEALVAISEHAVAPPLSPAASAVLKAANKYTTQAWSGATYERYIHGIVASLRAAADQICMKEPLGDTDADAGVFAAHHAISTALCDIAAELEDF